MVYCLPQAKSVSHSSGAGGRDNGVLLSEGTPASEAECWWMGRAAAQVSSACLSWHGTEPGKHNRGHSILSGTAIKMEPLVVFETRPTPFLQSPGSVR